MMDHIDGSVVSIANLRKEYAVSAQTRARLFNCPQPKSKDKPFLSTCLPASGWRNEGVEEQRTSNRAVVAHTDNMHMYMDSCLNNWDTKTPCTARTTDYVWIFQNDILQVGVEHQETERFYSWRTQLIWKTLLIWRT